MTSLVPAPSSLVAGEGAYALDAETRITAPDELSGTVAWRQSALRLATGLPLREGADLYI